MADKYSRTPSEAAADRRLSATDLRVLVALGSWANSSGHAFPRPSSIAIRAGIDRRNLPGALARLVAAGYLKITKRARGKSDFWVQYRPDLIPFDPKDDAEIVMPGDENFSCGEMTDETVVMPGHEPLSCGEMTLVMPGHEPRNGPITPIERPKIERRGTPLPPDAILVDEWREFALKERPDLDPEIVFENFKDYWTAAPGAKGRKLDWFATWRTWTRRERKNGTGNRKGETGSAHRNGWASVIAGDDLDDL